MSSEMCTDTCGCSEGSSSVRVHSTVDGFLETKLTDSVECSPKTWQSRFDSQLSHRLHVCPSAARGVDGCDGAAARMLKQGETAALQVHACFSRSCGGHRSSCSGGAQQQSRLQSNFKNDTLVVTVININQMRSANFLLLITMVWLGCTVAVPQDAVSSCFFLLFGGVASLCRTQLDLFLWLAFFNFPIFYFVHLFSWLYAQDYTKTAAIPTKQAYIYKWSQLRSHFGTCHIIMLTWAQPDWWLNNSTVAVMHLLTWDDVTSARWPDRLSDFSFFTVLVGSDELPFVMISTNHITSHRLTLTNERYTLIISVVLYY